MSTQVRTGDVVGRAKGLWTHVGVVEGNGVWHMSPGEPFRWTSWAEFAQGKPVKLLYPASAHQISVIRARARELEGTQWSVWSNCQDVAWKVATGVAKSPGRTGTIVGLGLLGLGAAFAKPLYRAFTTSVDASGYRRDRRGRFA